MGQLLRERVSFQWYNLFLLCSEYRLRFSWKAVISLRAVVLSAFVALNNTNTTVCILFILYVGCQHFYFRDFQAKMKLQILKNRCEKLWKSYNQLGDEPREVKQLYLRLTNLYLVQCKTLPIYCIYVCKYIYICYCRHLLLSRYITKYI